MEIFRQAELTPTEVFAGDSNEFIIRLTLGNDYVAGPSRIMADLPGTLGMSRPALLHTEDNGFVAAYVSNPRVTWTVRNWDMEIVEFATRDKGSWRGMAQRIAVLDLSAGLAAGDVVEIHWGDSGHGYGPGTKVTTVVPKKAYRPVIHVRYFSDQTRGVPDLGRDFKGYDRPVPDAVVSLDFLIRPREPRRLRLIRRPDRAMLLPLDVFWNVADVKDTTGLIQASQSPADNGSGVFEYFDRNIAVKTRGLPLHETAGMIDVLDGYNIYWGDIHTHSAFSNDCIEREKLDSDAGDLMDFGRRRAGLDFMAITDHHQPWDVERNRIGRPYWDRTMEALARHDRAGEFLVFAGIEYRDKRGDCVAVFNWTPAYDEIDRPEWKDIRQVWQGLTGRDYLTIPHFHNGGWLEQGQWWSPNDLNVEPVMEILSCHGSYEREALCEQARSMGKRFRPDQSAEYFISHGYRMGHVGNSDGHKGHIGSSGITAVFAKELTRKAILDAYRARRVYATSNPRIRLIFTANGAMMGSELPQAEEKIFRIEAVGEVPLKKVELFRDGRPHTLLPAQGRQFAAELKLKDAGPSNWYVRATQQDNHVAISSPVWFG
ncbi:MAG: DUF3604 domain-containing protein [Planctomycetes bacterium]|nr:DUF3604 domain-containing protein [Planctomycetota bacterium]